MTGRLSAGSDPGLADLEAERQAALASMAELEYERAVATIDQASYEGLRDEATARAATAIRALATARAAGAGGTGAGGTGAEGTGAGGLGLADQTVDRRSPWARPTPPLRSPGRRWLLAGAVIAFVIVAGILVGHYAGARQPGQTVSGGASLAPPAGAGRGSSQLSDGQVAADLVQGRVLAGQGDDVRAAKLFSQVLLARPQQPEALAYEGWLLRLGGVADHSPQLLDQGRALVGQAIALAPSYPDAHVFLGYMLFQDEHDPIDAVAQFHELLSDHPAPALVARTAPTMAQAYLAANQPIPPAVAAAVAPAGVPAQPAGS